MQTNVMQGDFNISAINDNVPTPRYNAPFSAFRPNHYMSSNDDYTSPRTPVAAGPRDLSWHPNNDPSAIDAEEQNVKRPRGRKRGGGETPPPKSGYWPFLRSFLILGICLCLAGLLTNLFMPEPFVKSTLFAPAGAIFAALALFFGRYHWRVKELLAASFVCFLGATAAYYLGMKPLTLALPLILSGVIIGILSKTRLPALFSALGLMGLAYLASPLVEAPLSINPIQGGVIVSAIIGLIAVAGLVSSRSIMGVTLLALYSWITVWVFGSDLSQYALACFVFIIAAAQYHLGKSRLNIRAYSAISYIVLGWTISLLAFLTIQWGYLDLSHNAVSESGSLAKSSLLWLAGTYCALACILISGVVRRTRTHDSLIALFVTLLAIASLPLLSLQPEYFQLLAGRVENFEFIPGMGIILSAGGTMASFLMLRAGLSRNIHIYKFMGVLGFGAQLALILFNPQIFTEINAITYIACIAVMACFFALTQKLKFQNSRLKT